MLKNVIFYMYFMIPKVVFRYSWYYDEKYRELHKLSKWKNKKYPSEKQILNYIKIIEKLWKKDGKKILNELSKITRLQWKEKNIICYVVGRCAPFSDPLTLSVYEKYPDYFIDILIHELIHQLFMQNWGDKKSRMTWNYINKKYKNESFKTRIHIPLHAIHMYIFLKFFSETRLKREIKWISFLPDYKKSWEIVQKEGYKNIINEFVSRIK